MALCQLIITSKKIWFNLMTFLKIKNQVTDKEETDEENDNENLRSERSFEVSSQSDAFSINNSIENFKDTLNYNENQFIEEKSK